MSTPSSPARKAAILAEVLALRGKEGISMKSACQRLGHRYETVHGWHRAAKPISSDDLTNRIRKAVALVDGVHAPLETVSDSNPSILQRGRWSIEDAAAAVGIAKDKLVDALKARPRIEPPGNYFHARGARFANGRTALV